MVRLLRRVANEYPGRLLIGEAYLPVERLARYLGDGAADGFQRAFDFELSVIPWGAESLRSTIERAERFTPPDAEPTWALSNHDLSRHATRFGEDHSRLAALLLLSMRGTICLYAGEEIGMVDGPESPTPLHDRFGRDRQRTPMQWDASPAGGFTDGEPWLPLVDPALRNVADQSRGPASLLNHYRRLLALRRGSAIRDVRGWVWRSAFRLAAGDLKRQSSLSRGPIPEGALHDAHPDEELLQALQGLTPQQRAVIVLHYYADCPVGEIARRTGINPLAVRAHLSRGRKHLRVLLGDER